MLHSIKNHTSSKILSQVKIYTDGATKGNPGLSGWAYLAIKNGQVLDMCSGGQLISTNNRMELTAVIKAISNVCKKEIMSVEIISDSQYVINCATGKWRRNKNEDLWTEYDTVSKGKNINFIWVKGHSGNSGNDIVDMLASDECYRHRNEFGDRRWLRIISDKDLKLVNKALKLSPKFD